MGTYKNELTDMRDTDADEREAEAERQYVEDAMTSSSARASHLLEAGRWCADRVRSGVQKAPTFVQRVLKKLGV